MLGQISRKAVRTTQRRAMAYMVDAHHRYEARSAAEPLPTTKQLGASPYVVASLTGSSIWILNTANRQNWVEYIQFGDAGKPKVPQVPYIPGNFRVPAGKQFELVDGKFVLVRKELY